MNGQQQTVISAHQLDVVVLAMFLGLSTVLVLVVLWAMFRAVYVTRQMGGRR